MSFITVLGLVSSPLSTSPSSYRLPSCRRRAFWTMDRPFHWYRRHCHSFYDQPEREFQSSCVPFESSRHNVPVAACQLLHSMQIRHLGRSKGILLSGKYIVFLVI